jgi:hypothetical protein
MNRILVGIVDGHPGWELLLSQEGVPYGYKEQPAFFEDCSLLVAGDRTAGEDIHRMREFLRKGRAILCSGVVAEALTGKKCRQRLIKSVLPSQGSQFDGTGLADLYLPGRVFPGSDELPDERSRPTTYYGEFDGGQIIVLPFDPASAMIDQRTIAKSYYAPRQRLPYEHVPLVSKHEVRKIVSRALEILHRKIGLPYVHRWYYPGQASTIAAFRVDTDFANAAELQTLSDLSASAAFPFSWFIDVHSQLAILDIYRSMPGQDFGLHCFRHRRYKDAHEASADIGEGLNVLRAENFTVRGCALPYGQWSPEIGKVLEQHGFQFSSEFAYDVDNLPSYPDLGYHRSGILQVPVHPISIGSLRRQGFSGEEMIRYYDAVVVAKVSRREPVFMYHHPKNGGEEVLGAMFSAVRAASVKTMTMADYAAWWAERADDLLTVGVQSDRLLVSGRTGKSDALLRIVGADGREAFAAVADEVKMQTLSWSEPPLPVPLPEDYRRIRRYNPWVALHRAEDVVSALFRPK